MKPYEIKCFRVSKETHDLYRKTLEGTKLKSAELSRLLVNKALRLLNEECIKNDGDWDKVVFSVRDLN